MGRAGRIPGRRNLPWTGRREGLSDPVSGVHSEPGKFIPVGDRIAVFVHARVRAKDSEVWQDVRLADVYTFRKGKAVQMRAFADRQEALRWVGM